MDDKLMIIHTKKKPKIHVKTSEKKNHKEQNIKSIKRSPKVVKCSKVVRVSADKKRKHIIVIKKSGNVRTIKLQNNRIKQGRVLHRKKQKNKSQIVKIKTVSKETKKRKGEKRTNTYQKHQRVMNVSVKPIITAINTTEKAYKNTSQNEKSHNTGKRIKKVSNTKKIGIKSIRKSGMDTMVLEARALSKKALDNTLRSTDKKNKSNKSNKSKATRNRMIQLFINKLKQENTQDGPDKVLKDIVMIHLSIIIKKVASYIGSFLASLFFLTALLALPIIGIIAIIYNSPFAIFLPSISSGESTQEVLSAYIADFYRDVHEESGDYDGYDSCEVIYVGDEGEETPDNYRDIIAVYMVKHGWGDTATDMTNIAKSNLKKIFDDMCSYSISSGTEEWLNEDGNEITYQIKYINISLRTYQDMIEPYGFSKEEDELMNEIMNLEYLDDGEYDGSFQK